MARPGQMTGYWRAYTFKCVCGLQVKGFYQVADLDAPLDKKQARCSMMKGAPAYPPTSRVSKNTRMERVSIGCGKTLEEVDRINEEERQRLRVVNGSIGNHPYREKAKRAPRRKKVEAA